MEDKSIALPKSTEISVSFRDSWSLSISYKKKKKGQKCELVSSDMAALQKTTAFCK